MNSLHFDDLQLSSDLGGNLRKGVLLFICAQVTEFTLFSKDSDIDEAKIWRVLHSDFEIILLQRNNKGLTPWSQPMFYIGELCNYSSQTKIRISWWSSVPVQLSSQNNKSLENFVA